MFSAVLRVLLEIPQAPQLAFYTNSLTRTQHLQIASNPLLQFVQLLQEASIRILFPWHSCFLCNLTAASMEPLRQTRIELKNKGLE